MQPEAARINKLQVWYLRVWHLASHYDSGICESGIWNLIPSLAIPPLLSLSLSLRLFYFVWYLIKPNLNTHNSQLTTHNSHFYPHFPFCQLDDIQRRLLLIPCTFRVYILLITCSSGYSFVLQLIGQPANAAKGGG